jgi:hypothetical protein
MGMLVIQPVVCRNHSHQRAIHVNVRVTKGTQFQPSSLILVSSKQQTESPNSIESGNFVLVALSIISSTRGSHGELYK